MEWDTGAGHAVAKVAGCSVIITRQDEDLTYNKENLLIPGLWLKNHYIGDYLLKITQDN